MAVKLRTMPIGANAGEIMFIVVQVLFVTFVQITRQVNRYQWCCTYEESDNDECNSGDELDDERV